MELDKIVKKIAGLYLGSAIFAVIMAILTLGQPFVVLAGIGALGLITVLGDAIAEYGIEAVLNALYIERSKNESIQSLLNEIEALPITGYLKFKLKNSLNYHQTNHNNSEEILPDEQPRTVEIES